MVKEWLFGEGMDGVWATTCAHERALTLQERTDLGKEVGWGLGQESIFSGSPSSSADPQGVLEVYT